MLYIFNVLLFCQSLDLQQQAQSHFEYLDLIKKNFKVSIC